MRTMTWFTILKKGPQKAFKKWLRAFIREHLEGMEPGEMIATKEMFELVEREKSEGTFLTPSSGIKDTPRPEMQIRFGRTAPKVTINLIAQMLRENKDIIKRVLTSPKSTITLGWERI